MNKKKSLFLRLLPWIIVAVLLAALIIFVFVPIYSAKEPINTDKPEYFGYSGDGSPLTMENDKLLFTLDPTTTQFTVQDKLSGQIWRSNPEDADSDPLALPVEKERLKSTMILTYSDGVGTITHYNNYSYSVENGVYDVQTLEDGAIKVNYTVGRVNKTFFIPIAVPEARMDELTSTMTKSEKRKALDPYRLYNPSKLKASDDEAALKAKYPELNNGSMYVLRDGIADHVKTKLQTYFTAVGYDSEDYYSDLQYIAGEDNTISAVFNASIIYRLEDGDLLVEVPYDDIRYNTDYPLTYITPLPFFGSTGTDDNGYMLLPDGGGAIIRYNNGKLAQNSYYANMYGWDWATERKQAVNETRCSFPLFAMTGGENAFMCMLEGNVAYAALQADISGRGNSYNTCSARYAVLHSDQYDVSLKSNNRVFIYEQAVPEGTIKQRYRFMQTTDYAQMAQNYRAYLQKQYPNLTTVANEAMPVSVEVLGAIDKTQQRFGLPVTVPIPMTTFDQAGAMMDTIQASGIENLKMVYTGWANGGLQQNVLTSVHIVGELGNEQKLKQLTEKAANQGVDLYLDGAVEFAYDSDLWNGFIAFRDAAKYTTRDRVKLYPYSTIWYTPMKWRDVNYLVQPEYMVSCAKNLISAVDKYGAKGVMFRDVGAILSADYNPRKLVTREQSKALQLGIMQDARDTSLNVATKLGNDYALTSSNLITEMDLNGGAYSIFDLSVPFYQIALHGLVEYTGAPVNLSGDHTQQLLKAAEYGAGLNFSLMHEQARVLQDSFYSGYFGSNFNEWGDTAIKMATDYQQAMKGLGNKAIVSHERVNTDVAVTTYENGACVYVNYGEKPYTLNGVTVAARSYTVKGGR